VGHVLFVVVDVLFVKQHRHVGLVVDDDDEEVGGWLLSEGYGSFATCKG